jgi:hypothetical protein
MHRIPFIAAVTLLATAATLPQARAEERASASSSAAARPPEATARPEVALGLLQGAAGYAAEIGGVVGAFAIGFNPKNLGWRSDAANPIFIGILAPALAAGAVCGTGLLSARYRGRCAPTFLGAYAGAALGGLLGLLAAPSPGPDDTQAFISSIYSTGGILLLAPIGALLGYHFGNEPLAGEQGPPPPVAGLSPPSVGETLVAERGLSRAGATAPPQMIFSLVDLPW